ncbi:MAG TPA: DUF4352 domain-containing protein [Actinoplanes sp.]|nr:DUF4352 domain-containing protein [Actinoplanes sp.]
MAHDLRQRHRPIRAARRPSPIRMTVVVLLAAGAAILLFAAGLVAGQYRPGDPPAGTPATTSPATVARPRAGKAVRDGRFEFTVTRTDCSRSTVGAEHLQRTAEGRFCVVSLTVRNIGDEDKYFVGRAQSAYDTAGTEYSSDELAGLYANRGIEAFVQQLAPGAKVTGKLVFDVPKGARLAALELHDSPLSGGVRVPITPD